MNDREHNVVELSGNQKLAILQPFLCLCCCSCIGSQRSYKIWTGLSGILGVTYYHEKLAGRKSLLVFCVCLCNLEHTVLLKSLYFSLVRKKKIKLQPYFWELYLFVCLFNCFWDCICACSLPQPPASQMLGCRCEPGRQVPAAWLSAVF